MYWNRRNAICRNKKSNVLQHFDMVIIINLKKIKNRISLCLNWEFKVVQSLKLYQLYSGKKMKKDKITEIVKDTWW